MLSVLLFGMTMPNTKMEVEERKTNLQKASKIQLEMLGMIEISIEPNKSKALADWRYECQMQTNNVCKVDSSQEVAAKILVR